MTRIRAIVIAAQDEEIRPVLDALTAMATKPAKLACPIASAWVAASTHGNILIMRTGIGLVATANALGVIACLMTGAVAWIWLRQSLKERAA